MGPETCVQQIGENRTVHFHNMNTYIQSAGLNLELKDFNNLAMLCLHSYQTSRCEQLFRLRQMEVYSFP